MKKIFQYFVVLCVLLISANTFASGVQTNTASFHTILKEFQGKPDVDLFSGAFTYGYPLWIPEGRNGMQPNLRLNYSSNNRGFETFLAHGWTIPSNSVFRSPKKGITGMYSEEHFSAEVLGSYEELVLIDAANDIYAPKNEGSFSSYQYQNNQWVMTDAKGTEYTFGTSSTSRQQDPNDSTRVYKWLLEKVEDTNGNFMTFSYFHDQGQVYPDTIRYTGHGSNQGTYEVKFVRESKNEFTSYQRAFKAVTAYRLDRIELYSHHGSSAELIRSYNFTYEARNKIIDVLTSITVKNGSQSLPATQFAYYDGSESDSAKRMNLMKQITSPEGGKQTIRYHNSATLRNADGSAKNPMPFNVNLVKEISVQATSSSPVYTTEYMHEGGHFYFTAADAYKRSYAGFHKVTVTDPDGNIKNLYFHQSENSQDGSAQGEYSDHIAKKGKLYREEQFDNSGNLYSKKIYTWKKNTLSDADPDFDRYFVYLEKQVEAIYDGDSDNKSKAIAYKYDAYGNVIKTTDYGEVTVSSDNGSFSDTGSDKVETTITYALNTTDNIVSLPSQQIAKDNANTVIADKKFYYDGLSLGQVNTGDQTKVETLVESPSRWVTETTAYNSYGLPTQVTDARNNSTSFTYDAENLFVASITNALNQTTNTTYDYLVGKVATTTDPNGVKTETTYDSFGRVDEVKQSTESALNTLVTVKDYSYNTSSIPNSVTENVYAQGKTVSKIDYVDGFGKLIQTKQQTGTSEYVVSTQEYDARGNVKKKYLPKFTSSSSYENGSGTYELMTYDALNRVTQIQNSVLGTSSMDYDQWEKSVTDYEGNTKDFMFDARENLVEVKEYLNATAYTTIYDYNALNNLLKITDAEGNEKDMSYDLRGKKLSENLFHDSSASPSSKTFVYDNNGSLTSKTDLKNQTITYVYDALNRPTSEVGTATITYAYDSGFVGKLDTITDPDVTKSYVYDNLGRVATEQVTIDSVQYDTSFTYDILGNVLTQTYPNSKQVTYTYDSGLKPYSAQEGTTMLVSSVSYTPVGTVDEVVYGNGTTADHIFDNLNRITNKNLKKGSTTLQSIDYTYDKVSNVKTLNEQYGGVNKNRTYSYDDLYRLTQSAEDIDGIVTNYDYSYDIIGNMLSSPAGIYSYAGTHPHAVSSVGSTTYIYDNNGDLTSDGILTHSWDERGTMIQSTDGTDITTYTYDGSGQRVKKVFDDGATTKTTIYVNDGYDVEDGVEKVFVMIGDTKIATLKSGTITYHHSDHLSSGNVDTDELGDVVEYVNYEPYGSVNEQEGSNDNDYKFTGKELDSETDLYYYEARYYDHKIGRFVSVDNWGGDLKNPQTLNKYSYTLNNPLKYNDPSGNVVQLVAAVAFATMDAGLNIRSQLQNNGGDWSQVSYTEVAKNAAEGAVIGAVGGGVGKVVMKGLKNLKTAVQGVQKAEKVVENTGRGKNKLKPDSAATGEHSTFRRNQDGNVSGYATWQKNTRNPSGFQEKIRVDTQYAKPHSDYNKVTKENIRTPHVHDRSIPGGVRSAKKNELPK